MDESNFRQMREAVAGHPCAFEKAMLAGACACPLAGRHCIAEREAVTCSSQPERERCAALRALLRQNSAFALKLTQAEAPLPHAKEMKLQCGGLQGVQQALAHTAAVAATATGRGRAGQEPASVADVRGLVRAAHEEFGSLQNLPYSAIVQSVVAHQIRRRRPQQ